MTSRTAGTTRRGSVSKTPQKIILLLETGSHYLVLDGLELTVYTKDQAGLKLRDPLASAS